MPKQPNPVALLMRWAGKDRVWLIASIVLSFISGLCTMVPYWGVYQVMDAVYRGVATPDVIVQNATIVAIGVVVRFIFFGTSGICSHKGAYNMLFRVRCVVAEHLSRVPLGALGKRSIGSVKTVLNEDIEKLELFLAHHLPEVFYYLTGPVAVFIFLLTVNVPLALVSLIPLVAAVVVMAVMFRGAGEMMGWANTSISNLNSVMVEYVNGMRVIKALDMGSRSFKRFHDAVDEEHEVWCEMSRRMGPPFAAYIVIIECGLLLMVPLGGLMFMNGSITGSVFLLFAFVGSLYLTEIRPLQELATNFAQVVKGATKAQEILDIPVFEGGGAFPDDHDVELDHIHFSYDEETEVLHDVSLKVAAGERIAIVGASGAGKTTIVELIARFYDVSSGQVRIGGVDVRAIDYEQLLANIAIVFQKTFLTSGTLLENIRMVSNASIDEVRRAARAARIDEFIMDLPQGYDTLVGNLGGRLSGGQRQRIAIARAILKNAPILILDEASSASDPENQMQIDQALEYLYEGKTVFIVAHRLDVVETCDRVAVVEQGRITNVGTHSEVFEKNEYYRNAWTDYQKAGSIAYVLGDRLADPVVEGDGVR